MGATQSKSEQVTELINRVTTNVLSDISTSAKGAVQQSNQMTISGISGSTISGISQSNEANIQISAVQQSAQTGQLQSQLSAAISQALSQNANTIGYANLNTSVTNKVNSVINSNISAKSVSDAFVGVTQSNALLISDVKNSTVSSISQTNIGKAIASLMSSSVTDIIAALGIQADVKTTSAQAASNPISSLADSISSAFGGSGLFIILIIAAAAVGFFMFKQEAMALWNQYYPYDLYGVIGIAVATFIWIITR